VTSAGEGGVLTIATPDRIQRRHPTPFTHPAYARRHVARHHPNRSEQFSARQSRLHTSSHFQRRIPLFRLDTFKGMKTTLGIVILGIALFGGVSFGQDPIEPAKMSEQALLAKARQIVQEEFELSKIAVRHAGKPKVKEFAVRAAKRGEEMDKKLTELAGNAGVTEPQRISPPMQERLTTIENVKGESFDPDYHHKLLDMQENSLSILDQLAKRAEDPKLREFARKAAANERAERIIAQKLAAPDVPHVKPQQK
jgi:predicted outer membrane protein